MGVFHDLASIPGGVPLMIFLAVAGLAACLAAARWGWLAALASVVGGVLLMFGLGVWLTYAAGHPAVPPTPDGDLRPLAVLLVGSIAFLATLVGGAFLMIGAAIGLVARALWGRRAATVASTPPRSA